MIQVQPVDTPRQGKSGYVCTPLFLLSYWRTQYMTNVSDRGRMKIMVKFILSKLVACGLFILGLNLLWLGFCGIAGTEHVRAPFIAVGFGLGLSVFGFVI